ncbi:TlpA family protein disulfide reductase [Thiocapsa marina]|uniref:Alkyl hydroperoxide reductase/ Thiol specific antioxidant/ Mal allergen n=1 Tax=Thiocapsa marina 5811 TaxID=768671 RepID=F9U7Y7_9GAMM|nr:TlpA disulfide reductase family protein [Thiocapsa marina]EGV19767.1 alkyl hydroperoxide reductase/ Thiol specific antioxidant/ Mal allergen [Thiocapsa marina 5811]
MRSLCNFVGASALLFSSAALTADEPQTLTPMSDDIQAPEFDLQGPAGEPQRLADHRGKPVILNFWATWCPPCRAEMPSMQRAHETLNDEGVSVIAVNVGEDAETIVRFLSETDIDFSIPMDLDSEVVQSYPVKGLPTTFVIDPEGRLVYSATGEREWDDPALLDQVRALKTVP